MKLTSLNMSRFIWLLTLAFLVVSCKKENTIGKIEFKGDQVPLQISAVVEEEIKVNLTGFKSSAKNQVQSPSSSAVYVGLNKDSDFEVATFVKNPSVDSTAPARQISGSGSKATSHSGLKAASTMNTNVKYRLYIRNRTTGTWQTKVFSSNSTSGADTIQLYNYYNYDWYAFSNNTTSAADVPNILSGNNLEIMSGNNDLLWAKGEILASTLTGNKRLNIVFKHMLARVEVNLDYRGLFVDMMPSYAFNYTLAGSSSSSFRRGKLDVKTGAFIASSHEDYAPVATAIMLEPPYVDQQQYVYYTSENQNFTSLKLNYTNLNYTTYDGKNTVYSSADNKSVTLTGTGTGGIVTATGGKTVLDYIFIEAPVYFGNSGTTKWARANLYFEGRTARNPYRFHRQTKQGFSGSVIITPNNVYQTYLLPIPSKDMFMKNHLIPDSYVNRPDPGNTTLYPRGDPCLEVLPKGAWKRASFQDFVDIIAFGIPKNSTYYKSVSHVVGYYNSTNISSPYYESRFLTFERSGYMAALNSTVTDVNEGFYWTDLNAGFGAGALFRVSGSNPLTWSVYLVTQTIHTAASIRCVRSNLYP